MVARNPGVQGQPLWRYIIAGPPLEQISIAEPLAAIGETCLSPQAGTGEEDRLLVVGGLGCLVSWVAGGWLLVVVVVGCCCC